MNAKKKREKKFHIEFPSPTFSAFAKGAEVSLTSYRSVTKDAFAASSKIEHFQNHSRLEISLFSHVHVL